MNRKYFDIINIIRKNKNDNEILECLSNYHENDIADIIAQLTADERKEYTVCLVFREWQRYLYIWMNRKDIWKKFRLKMRQR